MVPVVLAAEQKDEDEDEGDEGDEDEDEEADPFAFAMVADPSTFIDVREHPEEYRAMLEREARGEIHIVHRYRKSFRAKLSQSLDNVQDYYSELKNALLSFKGVKGRISWSYEAFNKGRMHVAKMDAKSRTLYLYLAIDPEQLTDTKYNFVDVSGKKKYATTPVLMKIKGERKFKHALELITMLCGDQMQLPHLELEPVDYRVPRLTIDELVEEGSMKHLAGYAVLTPVEEPETPAEEPAETAPADGAEAEGTEAKAVAAGTEPMEAPEATEEAPAETTEEAPAEATEEAPAEATEEAPAEEGEEKKQ